MMLEQMIRQYYVRFGEPIFPELEGELFGASASGRQLGAANGIYKHSMHAEADILIYVCSGEKMDASQSSVPEGGESS